ncbi:rho-related GTP-binding protein RhoN isoform X1 [Dasypus novemcinctus]|uniref:rho-related GTP-binding protein RhoN isoform X1 n=1 Tax=Dasypus novemcinctus TaxID=9361 RepID=UPI0039C97BE5
METESYDVTTVLSYVPTVFENYTASFEIDKRRIELNMWDTSGSSYYDNVRPLAYPDSDAVLICFDISRPETLDSVLKKWQGETQEFCPNAKVVLVGCKLDMRTDLATLRELSKQRLIPVTHEQGSVLAKQVGAVSYVECSSRSSERSVRDVFHVATVASLGRGHRQLRRTDSRRGLQRSTQLSGRPDRGNEGEIHKDRAKSCNLMDLPTPLARDLWPCGLPTLDLGTKQARVCNHQSAGCVCPFSSPSLSLLPFALRECKSISISA